LKKRHKKHKENDKYALHHQWVVSPCGRWLVGGASLEILPANDVAIKCVDDGDYAAHFAFNAST